MMYRMPEELRRALRERNERQRKIARAIHEAAKERHDAIWSPGYPGRELTPAPGRPAIKVDA